MKRSLFTKVLVAQVIISLTCQTVFAREERFNESLDQLAKKHGISLNSKDLVAIEERIKKAESMNPEEFVEDFREFTPVEKELFDFFQMEKGKVIGPEEIKALGKKYVDGASPVASIPEETGSIKQDVPPANQEAPTSEHEVSSKQEQPPSKQGQSPSKETSVVKKSEPTQQPKSHKKHKKSEAPTCRGKSVSEMVEFLEKDKETRHKLYAYIGQEKKLFKDIQGPKIEKSFKGEAKLHLRNKVIKLMAKTCDAKAEEIQNSKDLAKLDKLIEKLAYDVFHEHKIKVASKKKQKDVKVSEMTNHSGEKHQSPASQTESISCDGEQMYSAFGVKSGSISDLRRSLIALSLESERGGPAELSKQDPMLRLKYKAGSHYQLNRGPVLDFASNHLIARMAECATASKELYEEIAKTVHSYPLIQNLNDESASK